MAERPTAGCGGEGQRGVRGTGAIVYRAGRAEFKSPFGEVVREKAAGKADDIEACTFGKGVKHNRYKKLEDVLGYHQPWKGLVAPLSVFVPATLASNGNVLGSPG